jgi:nucleoside phosphorylase
MLVCHDDDKTVEPTGRSPDVVLTTPNTDDGAVLLTIDGAVDSVQGTAYVTFATASPTGARVVMTGNIAGGVIARLYVPDVSAADQYLPQLVEVAQRGTYALRPPTSYQLELRVDR